MKAATSPGALLVTLDTHAVLWLWCCLMLGKSHTHRVEAILWWSIHILVLSKQHFISLTHRRSGKKKHTKTNPYIFEIIYKESLHWKSYCHIIILFTISHTSFLIEKCGFGNKAGKWCQKTLAKLWPLPAEEWLRRERNVFAIRTAQSRSDYICTQPSWRDFQGELVVWA